MLLPKEHGFMLATSGKVNTVFRTADADVPVLK